MKVCKSASRFSPIVAAFMAILMMPGISQSIHSGMGLAYAQGNRACAPYFVAADEALQRSRDLQEDLEKEEEYFATLSARAIQDSRQITNLRAQIGDLQVLIVFTVQGSDARKKLLDLQKVLEGRLKTLTDEEAKLVAAIPKGLADLTSARDAADLGQRAAQDAIARFGSCMADPASTIPAPASPQISTQSSGGSVFELVDVKSDPAAPYSYWTWKAGGGQIEYREPSGLSETFQWTQPPQRFGADGFPIDITVVSKSIPGSRANAGMHVGGDFVRTPSEGGVEALSENGQTVTKSIHLNVSPGRPVSSPGDYYVRVGADYGPSFVYHYRVSR